MFSIFQTIVLKKKLDNRNKNFRRNIKEIIEATTKVCDPFVSKRERERYISIAANNQTGGQMR